MSHTAPITIRLAHPDDAPQLQIIRQAAFAPVFASFQALLGAELAAVALTNTDDAQAQYLETLMQPSADGTLSLHVAVVDHQVVGFVAIHLEHTTHIGEIGLNAVHPDWAGQGIGTAMYTFALDQMRAAGMRAATVSTGGDDSHAPARRAYQKVGFTAGIPSIWYCQEL